MAWINLLILACVFATVSATRREDVADVREGQDVTLECRVNNPMLLTQGGQIYWMRQRNGEKDNVAIRETPFDPNYTVDLEESVGRYDLRISRAKYERDNGMFECRVKEPGTGSDLHTTTVNLTVLIPPGSATINPAQPTTTEKESIDLVCSSQGGSPDPQITWYRSGSGPDQKLNSVLKPGGGRDFPTTSVLTIIPGKDDDGAQYRCAVWNRALTNDEKMEARVTLSVNYYPRITIGPENPLRVELDRPATLTCNADAKPPVSNVRWTRSGRFIDTRNTFVRDRITMDDAGRYVCQAENGLGIREAEVTLDVLYGPRVSVISSKDVDVDDEIMITCNVTANPAPVTVKWLKEGDDSFHQSGNILRLGRVSALDQGNYVCQAINILNPTGEDSSNRVGNATVAVKVRHAPGKTIITPTEPIAVQGEQSTLTCGADPPGWPIPSYRWWRKDQDRTLTLGANYTIPRASLNDEGDYYCQPSNSLGKGSTASTHIRVHQPPRILEKLPETAIHRMSTVGLSLTCRAQGKPQPSIRWLKDGVELKSADGFFDILVEQSSLGQNNAYTVQSTLHFRGTQRLYDKLLPTDRGTYECVFKNDVREESSSQLLRVEHSPITVHKTNKVAFDVGEDAHLECRMQAYPVPTFQWLLGHNFIEPDNTHYTTNDTALPDDVYASELIVRGVSEDDYGSYTCKGINTMGDHKTIINLQKKSRPESPTNLRVVNLGTEFIELAWDESFNGGFPETIFTVRSETSGESMSHDCQRHNPCVIQSLSQQTSFKLQVKASNIKGHSDFSDPLEVMTLVNVDSIPKPEEVYFERTGNMLSFRVLPTDLMLQGQVEIRKSDMDEWIPMREYIPVSTDSHNPGKIALGEEIPEMTRIRFCSIFAENMCGKFQLAKEVDYFPPVPSKAMSMQHMVAIIVGCVTFVAVVALVFICCCCRRRNSKLKNKTADMEVSHRGVVTQQAPPPPYYTVGMDNKGLDGSMDTGLDDPSKTAIYSSQQYHSYNQNGHINNGQNNNGMGYMDNSYSNSNNGGSVNSQDSLWQVKGHGDPQMAGGQMSPHMSQDPRAHQYDPMVHGGYGITGYDDYSHYPPAGHQGQGMDEYPGSRGNYMANGDPYAAVNKPRKRTDHMDGSYDVSGMPDPYMDHYDQGAPEMHPDNKPQISFDESLESGYSTPNSRNRRIIREIIV